jgi:hypothetical protein
MPSQTLFSYVDGFDLDDIAEPLARRLDAFVRAGEWVAATPTVVNQRRTDDGLRDGDLPPWDLGLNLVLPDVGSEPQGWFRDVERVARFLAQMHAHFNRDFVIGVFDSATGQSEDLVFVDGNFPDLAKLRLAIGVEPAANA